MVDFKSFKLNDGGAVPTIAFGTGTSFFKRNDDVADAVVKGIKVRLSSMMCLSSNGTLDW